MTTMGNAPAWEPQGMEWRAYIAGALHGDAWLSKHKLGLQCKDEDFARTFSAAVLATTGVNAPPKINKAGYFIVASSNKSGRFFGLREYQPANNDEVGLWLRGLFDSDGTAGLYKRDRGLCQYERHVSLCKTNGTTIEKAREYFYWLDIPTSTRIVEKPPSSFGTKPMFIIKVLRRDGFERFAEMVGSSIGRKMAAVRAITSSYQPEGWQAENLKRGALVRHARRQGLEP